ncbi:RING-H2 zinc finger protein [Novymonas esmeraldas]|uniref:RING-H2 zinc finger protein n=1 Tax=Novymonas esmeraldas TaxID=1808958 RepID=A0AAW0EK18_9TRYP
MAGVSTAGGAAVGEVDMIIPIQTKYVYVTARSVPREALLMADDCPICKGALRQPCVRCSSVLDDCPIVVGVCNHSFHEHCIREWQQGTCPLCRSPWQAERTVRFD